MMRLSRRTVLALPAALLARPVFAADAERLHLLSVGINAYRIRPLQGCVNDARLVSDAMRSHAASVTTLVDRDATRSRLLDAWRTVTGRCRPGDKFMFTFSGHGAQQPERIKGNEPDGMDEFLVLPDFHPTDAPGELLLDDELEAMLAEQASRGVRVTFFADCCHSGGTTRSIHGLGLGQTLYRSMTGGFDMGALLAATASAPPPPPPPPREKLAEVLFIAAGMESELVPEIAWEGRRHGALSVALATALAGMADRNGDGMLTRGELYAHVLRVARGLAEGRQHPGLEPAGRFGEAVFRLPTRTAGLHRAPLPARVATADPPVRLRIVGAGPAQATGIVGRVAHAAPAGTEADLTWDIRSGELVSQLGDLLAERMTVDELPGAVARVRAQRRLVSLLAASSLEVRLVVEGGPADIAAGDAAHKAGTKFHLETGGVRLPCLVIFNIAGNGVVQLLYPLQGDPEQIDPAAPPPITGFFVKPPFGSDLAVAVVGAKPLPGLLAALRRLDGKPQPLDAIRALEEAVTQAGDWQLGLQGMFTTP